MPFVYSTSKNACSTQFLMVVEFLCKTFMNFWYVNQWCPNICIFLWSWVVNFSFRKSVLAKLATILRPIRRQSVLTESMASQTGRAKIASITITI